MKKSNKHGESLTFYPNGQIETYQKWNYGYCEIPLLHFDPYGYIDYIKYDTEKGEYVDTTRTYSRNAISWLYVIYALRVIHFFAVIIILFVDEQMYSDFVGNFFLLNFVLGMFTFTPALIIAAACNFPPVGFLDKTLRQALRITGTHYSQLDFLPKLTAENVYTVETTLIK